MAAHQASLFAPLTLPCGVTLRNRIVKSAMSDSLGDGRGDPTDAQARLYERWAEGGVAVSIVGEVQGDPHFAEKPGNLVLRKDADAGKFAALGWRGSAGGALLWAQLGHAGAMAHGPISTPKGPSALDIPGLTCGSFTRNEIRALPGAFAETARLAQRFGFGGVQVHAAHGFLLSQFLSPLFNQRRDEYGGPLDNRMRLLLQVIDAVREAVGPKFPVAVKLNATDQLEGGFEEDDALHVVAALEKTSVDLIDISGGTYFPGAKSASDSGGSGPYFLGFARRARALTRIPLMLTGGFKTLAQAEDAISNGAVDVIGLARALVIEPALPEKWRTGDMDAPVFPRFSETPEGGVTAWYTMALTALGEDRPLPDATHIRDAMRDYDERDGMRTALWNDRFA